MKKGLWSLLQDDLDHCYFCGSPRVETHHVFGTYRKNVSEKEGCIVRVCSNCHTLAPDSIHRGHHKDNESEDERQRQTKMEKLHHDFQMAWEIKNHKNHEDFIRIFGKGYV